MLTEQIEIGGNPNGEECVPVSNKVLYAQAQRAECRAYIRALRKKFGPEPHGAMFKITSNPHDFGTYYEVACLFDESDERATEYAYNSESGLETWAEAGMRVEIKIDKVAGEYQFAAWDEGQDKPVVRSHYGDDSAGG